MLQPFTLFHLQPYAKPAMNDQYGALGASFIYLILRTTISQTSNEDQNGNGP